ncbi:MFS transporter [Nonomuraea terrae]|uniref:MFS transporter n=1 Tax=Nonomuraea terrae TaxID=2530383 RepID=UPI0024830AED|nr:MFS transporter [Nonomuraea terrae]
MTTGRLADLLRRRVVLAAGLVLFGAGALSVAFAPLWPVLLAGRLAQSGRAALMLPAALGLLLGHSSDQRRRGAITLWGSATGAGELGVHAFGGHALDGPGWCALYLPLGLTALALLLLFLPSRGRVRPTHVVPDVVGILLIAAATTALVSLLTYGGQWWPASLPILGGAAVALAGTARALVRARRHPAGVIDTALWNSSGIRAGALTSLLYGLMSFPLLTVIPLVLGDGGMTPGEAGLALVPVSTAVALASPFVPRLVRRVGLPWTIYAGAFLGGVGFLMLVHPPFTSPASLTASVALGVGFGIMSTSATIAGSQAVDSTRYAAAVGSVTTARPRRSGRQFRGRLVRLLSIGAARSGVSRRHDWLHHCGAGARPDPHAPERACRPLGINGGQR